MNGAMMATAPERPAHVRHANGKRNVVAILAFLDADVAWADLVAIRDDFRINLLLIRGHDVHVAVIGGDVQVGAGAYLIGL